MYCWVGSRSSATRIWSARTVARMGVSPVMARETRGLGDPDHVRDFSLDSVAA